MHSSHTTELIYPTGMLASEIAQQPDLWLDTSDRVQRFLQATRVLRAPLVFTGAGTSAYAGAAVANALPGARALPTTDLLLLSPAEIRSAIPGFAESGTLISLARSGDSPESVGVVERLQRLFPAVRHIAIICNPNGRLAHTPDVEVLSLDPRTNDRSLAMTSSFSCLTLAGMCLAHRETIAPHLQMICEGLRNRLPELSVKAEEVARGGAERFVVLTSTMHALATEASLKALELTAGRSVGVPEGFLAFRHGPISMLRKDVPVLCYISSDPHKRRYELDLLEDLKERALGRVALIGDVDASRWPHQWIVPAGAPMLPDALRTPFEIPFAQLFAYHLSIASGVDPDNPSPGGTVTRVVKPFRLHADQVLPERH